MNFLGFANVYAPFISLVFIGYCLSRWANVGSKHIYPLIRIIFLPVIIYGAVSSRIPVKTLTLIILSGAAITAISKMVFNEVKKRTSLDISVLSAFPNIVCFTFPIIAMVFGSRGFGTASSFLIGSYLVYEAMKGPNINWKQVAKEPMIFAAILGIVVSTMNLKIPVVGRVIGPIYQASFSMILIYLGTLIHPIGRLDFIGGLISVSLRMVVGFVGAIIFIKLFSFSGIVAKTIMLCAISPSGSPVGGFKQGSSAEKIGVIICFIFIVLMNEFRWRPWSL